MQPGFGHPPFCLNRPPRDAEKIGDFLICEPCEETKLHYFGLATVHRFQDIQRVIERNQSFSIEIA